MRTDSLQKLPRELHGERKKINSGRQMNYFNKVALNRGGVAWRHNHQWW